MMRNRSGMKEMEGGGSSKKKIWLMIILFLFGYSLTLLYHGMRGVMILGGFVASGGPYQIAHQAPDWIWIVPVSVIIMVLSVIIGLFMVSSGSVRPNLMSLAWSAIFCALGWNFLDFGSGFGKTSHLEWGWLACAFFFFMMGLGPLAIILGRGWSRIKLKQTVIDRGFIGLLILQVLVVVMAVWCGIMTFGAVF